MKLALYILLLILVSVSGVFAQKPKESKAEKYYELYSFDKAIRAYKSSDTLDIKHLRQLAQSYYNRAQFEDAEKLYEKLVQQDSCTQNDYYYYVLSLKASGKYELANKWMAEFKQHYPNDLRVKSYVYLGNGLDKLLKDDPLCKIKNLEVNTDADDFGTSFYLNQVVFTSSRSGQNPFLRNYNWNRKPFLDMYLADKVEDNELANARLWNKQLNKQWHEGPASFSTNGNLLAFTRNNYAEGSQDDVVRLQIFFSQYSDWAWSTAESFYLNNPEYSVGHPCLSSDGSKMFFTSDMPGGYGGADIYYIEKQPSGAWGKPVNLGENINTEANEMFPFYAERIKALYFASNGLAGLGGLDIFVSNFVDNTFLSPRNLGSPINSTADDFAFVFDSNSWRDGYFSSNRKQGKGGDDIYSFQYQQMPKQQVKAREYQYRLFVKNRANGQRIYDAEVKLGSVLCRSNLRGEVSLSFTDTSIIRSEVSAMGYIKAQKTTKLTIPQNGYDIRDTIYLDIENENTAIVLREIYYDLDKWDILPESKKELNRVVDFLKDNPNKQIELGSHTDSRGSHKYNIWLSQKRAESATAYIVSQGIDASRITPKGYGETRLINPCADGVPCTEPEHRANRRTELFVQGYGKAERIKQTKGKF